MRGYGGLAVQPKIKRYSLVVGQPRVHWNPDPVIKGGLVHSRTNRIHISPGWQVKSNKWKEGSSPAHVDK